MYFQEHLASDPIFHEIAQAARSCGVPAYVVGGYVRDLILKRPSKDIDVVCVGSGVELAEAVAKRLPGADLAVFKNFGTAMVKAQGWELEFVGARRESYRRDSRKPLVEDGTLEDDQNRRDFTINAMAIGLNDADYGRLIDPFGGVADLKRKLIRTPLEPRITFSDDPLRMMRAARFATQLGFDIDHDSFMAMTDEQERIGIVSQERIIEELNKIVLADKPSYGFKLLLQTGLLERIFPEFVALKGVETIGGMSHKDNFYHTLQVLDNIAPHTQDLWLRWAAILHDIAKPATKRFHKKAGWTFHGHEEKGARMVPGIFRQLKLPMDERMKFVQKLVRLHLRPIALAKETITDTAIRRLLFEAGDDIDALMALCRADITSKDDNRVKRYLRNFDLVEQRLQEVEEKDHLRNFQPVITGEIIMETFGLKPSRPVGEVKVAVREAILEGVIRNEYEEAFAYMLEAGRAIGLRPVQQP
jgi:putative nucleotidyltransferase with HDIG domain